MLKQTLFIIIVFAGLDAGAQNISIRKDTIYAGHEPLALFKKTPRPPFGYFITTLTRRELISFRSSHTQKKGKPGYVITFVADQKQGILAQQPGFPTSMVAELVKFHLFKNGAIDAKAEAEFLAHHPLPKGFAHKGQVAE